VIFFSLPQAAKPRSGEGGALRAFSEHRDGWGGAAGEGGVANAFARSLRKNLTPQEARLWAKLCELKPLGYHFRRQAPIRHIIVDFASFRDRLVIEVDGGQHNAGDAARKDEVRDAFLRGEEFRVLRFWNYEVDRNLDGVTEAVVIALRTPTRPA
jgi:very-short-patch-repair endonuclease